MYIMGNRSTGLNDEQLRKNAPSIFATEPWVEVSDRYKFIPTIEVVNGLRDSGFVPVQASQSSCRIAGKREFTKHMVKFKLNQDIEIAGTFPEIVLINSHDRTSSYQLMLGFFRLVCSNGMIVGDTIAKVKTRHSGHGDLRQDVIDASYEISNEVPQTMELIENWRDKPLTPEMQLVYAQSATELNPSTIDIPPRQLLQSRRYADRPNSSGERDLWTTYNVVQENLIKGGVSGRGSNGRIRRTRAVKAIDKDVKLNKALWTLTEGMNDILDNKPIEAEIVQ